MAPVTFRSRFNRVLSVVVWSLLAVVGAGTLATSGALPVVAGIVLGAAGVAALAWAILWAPHVTVDDEAVRIANVLQDVTIPWAALIHVDTRYALTLHTPGRRFRATAAPAPGQLTARRAARAEQRRVGRLAGPVVRPGDLPGTDSGQAAEMVRARWESLRDAGRIEAGVADRTPVEVRANPARVAALVLGAGAIVAAILSV